MRIIQFRVGLNNLSQYLAVGRIIADDPPRIKQDLRRLQRFSLGVVAILELGPCISEVEPSNVNIPFAESPRTG